MSQVTVTATTTTSPVTVECSRASLIVMTVTLAPTSVDQTILGQHDMVVLQKLILRDTVRGSAGLTNMPQQHQPQSQMLLRYIPTMPWVLHR